MLMPHAVYLVFLFALGACVGSFLNVVAYRFPLGKSVISPPSACPKCTTTLSWRDNIPIFGWLFLGGKCRYCKNPVSIRYPVVELTTALLFAGGYALMFMGDIGPIVHRSLVETNAFGIDVVKPMQLTLEWDWPALVFYLVLVSFMMAASLIDFDHFVIPLRIPWALFFVGVVLHAWLDRQGVAGSVSIDPGFAPMGMMGIGAAIGWLISMLLLRVGVLKQSFAEGSPMLDREIAERDETGSTGGPVGVSMPLKEYSKGEVRYEMRHEILFLLPPLVLAGVLGVLSMRVEPVSDAAQWLTQSNWSGGAVGAITGAAAGGLLIWVVRVFGSLLFGKEAMGLGDAHLMVGAGAILGTGPVVISLFLGAFAGLIHAVVLLFGSRFRSLPFGPYLAIGAILSFFLYRPFWDRYEREILALASMIGDLFG
jgi:leader peptidase (prepilin peptidase)/N-methyltransferase